MSGPDCDHTDVVELECQDCGELLDADDCKHTNVVELECLDCGELLEPDDDDEAW